MASSDWVTAVARWFLFLSLVTAAAVVAVRLPAQVGWWRLPATSAQLVAAVTIGCAAIAGARLLWHWHARRADTTCHGIVSTGPSADVARPAQTSVASFPVDPADPPMPHEWSVVGPPPTAIPRGRSEATDTAEEMTGTGSAPFGAAASTLSGSAEDHDRWPNAGGRPGIPTPSSIESSPSPTSAGVPADVTDRSAAHRPGARPGDGAMRLAEVLNLYERIGFLSDGRDGAAIARQDRVDGPGPERGLWAELVEEYGAASIDFDAASSGGCVITLDSGNLVFFDPDSRRWAWVVFDRAVPRSDLNSRATSPCPVAVTYDDAPLPGVGERVVAG